MIHISQEELFRKIELEHDQNNNLATIREKCHGSVYEKHDCCCSSRSSSTSSSTLTTTPSAANLNTGNINTARGFESDLGGGGCEADGLSSILPPSGKVSPLPKATATVRTIKDKNNNTCAHQTRRDEDEVQAVLITGCGSKIGSNIAVAFAARGLKVALVDFDIEQTDGVARECQDKSPKNRVPLQIVADISQLAEAHKVIDRTIEAFGRLDVLVNTVNNASLMEAKFNASGDDDPHVFEQYHKIIANNMHAVTYLCISAAPYLRKTKGSIVNVSSITNNETGSYKFAYCMSKAGISTLTKCLATDLAPDIKVICVSPKNDAT